MKKIFGFTALILLFSASVYAGYIPNVPKQGSANKSTDCDDLIKAMDNGTNWRDDNMNSAYYYNYNEQNHNDNSATYVNRGTTCDCDIRKINRGTGCDSADYMNGEVRQCSANDKCVGCDTPRMLNSCTSYNSADYGSADYVSAEGTDCDDLCTCKDECVGCDDDNSAGYMMMGGLGSAYYDYGYDYGSANY